MLTRAISAVMLFTIFGVAPLMHPGTVCKICR